MDIKEEALLTDAGRHWYYRAKLAALLRATNHLAPCPALDVGAGSGFFSRGLLEAGRATKAVCVDPGYHIDSAEEVAGCPLLFRRTLAADDADIGLMLMMDVLEHVEDDVGLARQYVEQIPSGASVIVTVPAFQWLWSGHDVFLEHYRRYTLLHLEKVLRSSGLNIRFGSYYYGAVLPIAAGSRLARRIMSDSSNEPKSDMREFGKVLNTLLWSACRIELPFLRINRIGGLSVFVLAIKP